MYLNDREIRERLTELAIKTDFLRHELVPAWTERHPNQVPVRVVDEEREPLRATGVQDRGHFQVPVPADLVQVHLERQPGAGEVPAAYCGDPSLGCCCEPLLPRVAGVEFDLGHGSNCIESVGEPLLGVKALR